MYRSPNPEASLLLTTTGEQREGLRQAGDGNKVICMEGRPCVSPKRRRLTNCFTHAQTVLTRTEEPLQGEANMCEQMPQLRKRDPSGKDNYNYSRFTSCKECVKIKITAAKCKHSGVAVQFTDLKD